jgi:hypothetical protein
MASQPIDCTLGSLSSYNYFDISTEGANCPVYSGFFGVMGATSAMVFSGVFSL